MGHEEKVGVERGTFAPCCVADCVGLVRHCMSSEGCHGIVCIYASVYLSVETGQYRRHEQYKHMCTVTRV